MALLNIPKTYQDTTTPFEVDLNNIRDSLLQFFNITGINDDNIQALGISSSKIIDGTLQSGKIAISATDDSTLTINNATKELEVKDLGIDTTQINNDDVITVKIVGTTITSPDFNDGAISIDKRDDRTVTTNGTDPGEGGLSGSVEYSSNTTSSSFVDVTNASTSITTTGRPVLIIVELDSSVGQRDRIATAGFSGSNNGSVTGEYRIVRDGSNNIAHFQLHAEGDPGVGATPDLEIPPSSTKFIDDIGAGLFLYKLQHKVTSAGDAGTGNFRNSGRLRIYEL